MRIDIDDFSVKIVGMKTLELVADKLKEYKEDGITGVTVDMRGRGINQEDAKFLAKMKYDTDCKYKGIGHKEEDIEVYLMTGYFLKDSMGSKNYVKWFKRQVEIADFPLLIRDNRLTDYKIVPMNIIQPLKFDGVYFKYKLIKPQYLEPKDLEQALRSGKNIYTVESIRVEEIGYNREGFRFAGTYEERLMLDIFEDIITGRVEGYTESPVG